jgi:hypothetical protein
VVILPFDLQMLAARVHRVRSFSAQVPQRLAHPVPSESGRAQPLAVLAVLSV